MLQPLIHFAEENGLADQMQILTFREDIPDLQAAADIFVMPSLWEGLPLALLEAMIAGSAVIASQTSGIPEAVTDLREGILVPPADEAALAVALKSLLTNAELRTSLGQAARARAHLDFTTAVMADRYEFLYKAASPSS
jgi:glycosyltransferase involved in cell wall biosynthesis